jgi:hypothetical protein
MRLKSIGKKSKGAVDTFAWFPESNILRISRVTARGTAREAFFVFSISMGMVELKQVDPKCSALYFYSVDEFFDYISDHHKEMLPIVIANMV